MRWEKGTKKLKLTESRSTSSKIVYLKLDWFTGYNRIMIPADTRRCSNVRFWFHFGRDIV